MIYKWYFLIQIRENLTNHQIYETHDRYLEIKNLQPCQTYFITVSISEVAKMSLKIEQKEKIIPPYDIKYDIEKNQISWKLKKLCIPYIFHVFSTINRFHAKIINLKTNCPFI